MPRAHAKRAGLTPRLYQDIARLMRAGAPTRQIERRPVGSHMRRLAVLLFASRRARGRPPRTPACWCRSTSPRSACWCRSTAGRRISGRSRPGAAASARPPGASARNGWRASWFSTQILRLADAAFDLLPQGLCDPRHELHLAPRRAGLARLRAAASGQCRDAVRAGAALRHGEHHDPDPRRREFARPCKRPRRRGIDPASTARSSECADYFVFLFCLLFRAAHADCPPGSRITDWVFGGKLCQAATTFGAETAGASPVLIVVVHGDISDGGRATYHVAFAKTLARPGRVVVALTRPGYTDERGRTSEGNTYGRRDNYTPRQHRGGRRRDRGAAQPLPAAPRHLCRPLRRRGDRRRADRADAAADRRRGAGLVPVRYRALAAASAASRRGAAACRRSTMRGACRATRASR